MLPTSNLARLLAMLPAAAALLAQTAPQPASVAGTVTNSVTGEPILRAHVTFTCTSEDRQQNPPVYGALSNEKGQFAITKMQPGNCSVGVQRPGFAAPRNTGSIPFSSGMHKEDMKLSLTPAGAIAGRVLDAAGEPVEGASVSAEGPWGGNAAVTGDRGQFRVWGLSPGRYRVKAAPRRVPYPPEIRGDGSTELRPAATYYPDSLSSKTAQQLEVKPGAEVSGIDIRLVQVPVVQVSGKVDMMPGAKGSIVMAFPPGQSAVAKADGTFAFWGLDPGKYMLMAMAMGGQSRITSTPVDIEVATVNLENLELRMMAPFDVAGQVRFDDDQARQPAKPQANQGETAPPPPPRRVGLRPMQQWTGQMANATVAEDDSFTLEKVEPGRYGVTISWGSGYVKSVRIGDTESAGNMLDVRNGSAGPLTLTVSSNFCEVSGTVNDSKGPVADVQVALSPLAESANTRVERTDSNGNYKFTAVVPGKYKLAAVDPDFTVMWFQTDILQDYDEVAESFDLSPGDKIGKDLRQRK